MDEPDSPKKKCARTMKSAPEALSSNILNGTNRSESVHACAFKDSVHKTLPIKVEDTIVKKESASNTSEQSENVEPWNMFISDLVTPKVEPDDIFCEEVSVAKQSEVTVVKPDDPPVEEYPCTMLPDTTSIEEAVVTRKNGTTIKPQTPIAPELVTLKEEPVEPLPEEAATSSIKIDKVVTLKGASVTPWTAEALYFDEDGPYTCDHYDDLTFHELLSLKAEDKHLECVKNQLKVKTDAVMERLREATEQKEVTLSQIEKLEEENRRMDTLIQALERRNTVLSSKVEELQEEGTDLATIVRRLDRLIECSSDTDS